MQRAEDGKLVSAWRTATKGLSNTLQRLPAIHKEEISELERQRAQCMKEGRIKAAKATEQQLQDLKLQQETEQLQALQGLHEQEAEQLEQQLADEYKQFIEGWDARMAALQAHNDDQQQQLLQKHLDEAAVASAAPQTVSQRQRPSPELLNLRRIQDTLLAQKQFEQALKTKHKADQLEAAEHAAHAAHDGLKPTAEGAKLLSKQAKEQEAQAVRLSVAQDEAVKKQQGELQRLMKRYQAARLALQRTQATERQQLELQLRAQLGLKRPSNRLETPDLCTSLADSPLVSSTCQSPCSSPPHMVGQTATATAVKPSHSPGSSAGSSPRSPQHRPRTAAEVYAAGPKPLSAMQGKHKGASTMAGQLAASNHGQRMQHAAHGSKVKAVVSPAKHAKSRTGTQLELAAIEPTAVDTDESLGSPADHAAEQTSTLGVDDAHCDDGGEETSENGSGSPAEDAA